MSPSLSCRQRQNASLRVTTGAITKKTNGIDFKRLAWKPKMLRYLLEESKGRREGSKDQS